MRRCLGAPRCASRARGDPCRGRMRGRPAPLRTGTRSCRAGAQGRRGKEPGDRRGATRTEAPCQRDRVGHRDVPADPVESIETRRRQAGLEALDESVARSGPELAGAFAGDAQDGRVGSPAILDRPSLDRHDQGQVDRQPETVVAGPEVRDRRRDLDHDPPADEGLRGLAHQPSAPRTPSLVAAASSTRSPAVRSAVSGSFSPAPVRTQTTRSPASSAPAAASFATPATLATTVRRTHPRSSRAPDRRRGSRRR